MTSPSWLVSSTVTSVAPVGMVTSMEADPLLCGVATMSAGPDGAENWGGKNSVRYLKHF